MQLAALYLTRKVGEVEVAPVEAIVTPDPWASASVPVFIRIKLIMLPVGKATELLGGIV